MTAVLAAAGLAISDKVDHYGALAGVAAVVGLGVLSLLYIAQAREVKRLREWAGRAPERDADLQQRVAADAQRRLAGPARPVPTTRPPSANVTATPVPSAANQARPGATAPGSAPAAGVPVPAAAAATAAAAKAAQGAGSPQPGAATTAAPAGALPATSAPGGPPAPAAAPGTVPPAPAPAPGAQPNAAPATTPPATTGPPATQPAATPAPATAAAAGTGAAASSARPAAPQPAAPRPATAAAGATAAAAGTDATARPAVRPATPAPAGAPRRRAVPASARATDAAYAPRSSSTRAEDPPRGSRRGLLAVVLGSLAIVAIAAFLITQVFSGDDSSTPPAPNTVNTTSADSGTSTSGGGTATRPPDRAGTRPAVLNGTSVQGLARTAADKLRDAKYAEPSPVTNNADRTLQKTVIAYEPSSRAEARDIAKILGVPTSALRAMDAQTRAAGENAPVVVIIGADRAQ